MRASATTILTTQNETARSIPSIISDLIKARLTMMSLITTWVGFHLGWVGQFEFWPLAHTMIGAGALASGAAALNQWMEKDLDAMMERTESRPIPAGLVSPGTALIFGAALGIFGAAYLTILVNGLSGALGALTFISYVFVYTPLKRVTTLNTVVGAIPGALPPLIGWTAATGSLGAAGWTLFMILFLWQMPHFMAIAWMYREDYARAGFKMLPVVDKTGKRTAMNAVGYNLALLAFAGTPSLFGVTGVIYFVVAILLSLGYLAAALRFAGNPNRLGARNLFLASIAYLPLLIIVMAIDKTV